MAKGPITAMSCDPTVSGLQTAFETDYVLGPGGGQLTELGPDGKGDIAAWARTHVYATGNAPLATYNSSGLYFRLTDWLGTLRAITDFAGVTQQICNGPPFGDGQTCTDQTEDSNYFTGKERDAESGNDYFGARYFASSMGRFLSPDPAGLWFARGADPQSWNLYTYGRNNPLINIDPTGLDCVYDDGGGNFHTTTGDCDNSTLALANAGHYIDCDGCTTNSTAGTLDPVTGTLTLTANGSPMQGVPVVSDWADPQGVTTNMNVGGTSYDVFGSGYGGDYYIPGGALPLIPNLAVRARQTSFWGDNAVYQWMMKWGGYISCGAGLDADAMNPNNYKPENSPQDSSDSTKETEGQGTVYGPNKSGKMVPYNNPEGAEKVGATGGGVQLVTNGGGCFANAAHQ